LFFVSLFEATMSTHANAKLEPLVVGHSKGFVGVITRGKTNPNRLRRSELFLVLFARDLLRWRSGLVVDLGFGASSVTTVSLARTVALVAPQLRVLGTDIDPARVRNALAEHSNAISGGGSNVAYRVGG
jgi:hypothetical protein